MNIALPKEACFEDIAVIVNLNRWMNVLSDPAVESRHSKILLTATIFVEILQCESFKQRSVIKIQTHINKRLGLDIEHIRSVCLGTILFDLLTSTEYTKVALRGYRSRLFFFFYSLKISQKVS